jgi:ribulose-phosphate 3-epimerase
MTVRLPLIKASIRSADLGHLADQIVQLEVGGIDAIHFDVMDGRFGPREIAMGPMFIRGLRKYTSLPFDVHLLVEEPESCLDSYIDSGADYLIVHLEACSDPGSALAYIRSRGVGAGLAINPTTSAASLGPYLDRCDEINVMAILPERPGELVEQGVENLREIARMARGLEKGPLVQVDGAVSLKTRDRFVELGAESMVAGYPVFSREDFGEAIRELRQGTSRADTGGS